MRHFAGQWTTSSPFLRRPCLLRVKTAVCVHCNLAFPHFSRHFHPPENIVDSQQVFDELQAPSSGPALVKYQAYFASTMRTSLVRPIHISCGRGRVRWSNRYHFCAHRLRLGAHRTASGRRLALNTLGKLCPTKFYTPALTPPPTHTLI